MNDIKNPKLVYLGFNCDLSEAFYLIFFALCVTLVTDCLSMTYVPSWGAIQFTLKADWKVLVSQKVSGTLVILCVVGSREYIQDRKLVVE